MDSGELKTRCLGWPGASEEFPFGDEVSVFKVGGKMFALANLDGDGRAVISYAAGPERYSELLEMEGVIPAPYMARIFWVAVERWDVFRWAEWEQELTAAHAITFAKMPPKTRTVLAMPAKEQKRLIRERKALLAERAAAKR